MMFCRLCLSELQGFVSIFDESREPQIWELIVKYLHIKLQIEDVVSNKICDVCWKHLNNFHQFCLLIKEKQQKIIELVYESDHNKERPIVKTTMEKITNNDKALGQIQSVSPVVSSPVQMKNMPFYEQQLMDAILDESSSQICENLEDLSEDKALCKDIIIGKTKLKQEHAVASEDKALKVNEAITSGEELFKTVIPKNYKSKPAVNKKPVKINPISNSERDNFIAKHLQLKCDICEEIFEKFTDLRFHFKKCHNLKPYVTSCCGARLFSTNELYEHLQWHLNPEYFKCDDCGQILQSRKSLNKHKRTNRRHKSKDADYKCELCGKTFAHSYLKKHMMIYHSEENFACEHCNKSFKIQQRLTKHIAAMHQNIISHVCDICGKIFKHKSVFDSHVLEHHGIIPPVQCELCGEWKKTKRLLNLHKAKHNKINTKCKYCERECLSPLSLRRHIRYMHNLKLNWQCKYCEKSFKTERSLKEHEATHTGVKLYNCQHCSHNSRSRSNMYVHVKNQHPREWLTAHQARKINEPANTDGGTNI